MKLFNFKKHQHSTIPQGVQGFWHGAGRDPYVDWPIIFSVSVIVTALLVTMSVYLYFDVGEILVEPASAVPVAPKNISDTAELDKILREFDTRASTTAQVENGYNGVGDPSR